MINHGNRGVPSFRIQISPFSYECPVSCPSTVHEPPKLESHHNDNQSYNVWHNYLSCHPFSSIDEFPMAYGDFLLPCLLTVPEVINHLPLQSTLDFGDPQMKPSGTKPAFLWVVFFRQNTDICPLIGSFTPLTFLEETAFPLAIQYIIFPYIYI